MGPEAGMGKPQKGFQLGGLAEFIQNLFGKGGAGGATAVAARFDQRGAFDKGSLDLSDDIYRT
jgi:hypothetical protein